MSVQRVPLYKHLPLDTPFSLHVFPIYKCNFACKYCLHALSSAQLAEKNFQKDVMQMHTFTKAIDDLKDFGASLKAIIFAGHGEPLLHPNISQMVKYAKDAQVTERVEITTNASLLNKKMADALIEARVDRLKISIQGTSAEKYKEVCQYNMIYDKFLENLSYFHSQKQHTEVYIKIVDIALDGDADKEKFIQLFSPVADVVGIEYAIPFIKELEDSLYEKDFTCCKQGNKDKSQICSMPFYMQVLDPKGNILPCCSSDVPIVLGNVHKQSLVDIWQSNKTRAFLRLQLQDKNKNPVCKTCVVPTFGLQEGDYLDAHKHELSKFYEG